MNNIEEKKNISRNLKHFYLDPNNYRFVDNKDYVDVNEVDIIKPIIQQRTRNFIAGKNREGVLDLINSFKANGFLEVDMIQLKKLEDDNYLVLEGNRRVTALKILQEDEKAGLDIGKLDKKIFLRIPSFIHENEDDSTHKIIMGLKHISGNKKWPAINQAKLIYDYLMKYWNDGTYYKEETSLCESLGITRTKLRTSQRAYHLILQYKKSDYGDQFNSDMYYTFAEITKRPSIKRWITWNDENYYAENEDNILRIFSWMSIREEQEDLDDDEIEDSKKFPPIITKYREIQDLAKFIGNESALEVMEEEKSVSRGLVASGSKEQESYEKSIKLLSEHIGNLDRLSDLLSHDDIEKLKKINKNFVNLLPTDSRLDLQNENVTLAFGKSTITHFNSITIKQYKIFKEFNIDKLNRINIFAGFNNTGKTTLLEAIYLLTKQNNIGAFFELIKFKNKLNQLNSYYLNTYLSENIEIFGIFNNLETSVSVQKLKNVSIDKKDDHIASYEAYSEIDGESLTNTIHTFEYNPLQRFYEKIEILCNCIFKSPYFYNKKEIINTHNKNVELKVFSKVIKFIQEHIDSQIENIEFTQKNDIERFLVDSKYFPEKSVDITSYGEGLQRVFEIALSFAYCKNGVLLIDEIETAIHYSLLIDFTRFVQELAIEFNVQVFITSHSKECINAFVENEFSNEDISAYYLKNKDGKVKASLVTGNKLQKYIYTSNFDLRGRNG